MVDASNPDHPEQIEQVMQVLREIGAEHVPLLLVFNKIDALGPERQPLLDQSPYMVQQRSVDRIFVSARTGLGLPLLRQALVQRILPASGQNWAQSRHECQKPIKAC